MKKNIHEFDESLTKNDLYSKLFSVGFRVNSELDISDKNAPDIESTIIEALYGVDSDSRLLSLIFSWLKVHGNHLIAEKFFKFYKKHSQIRGECPWFYASCAFLVENGDHRFKKGLVKQSSAVWSGGSPKPSGIELKGAVPYLKKLNIMMAEGSIRIREQDALSVEELIKKNHQYRNRFLYGDNWRADIITAIEKGMDNPYKISKALDVSYPSARQVFLNFMLVKGK